MPLVAFRTPRIVALLVALSLLAGAPAAGAHDFSLGALTIDHPWARASAGPVRTGAAFLAIGNSGEADRLVAVVGDVAERVELHSHRMEGDVMKMRPVAAVEIPAEGSAVLQPGGLHIMLIGLESPLREGEHFPLTLTFEQAGTITVDFTVEGVASMGPHGSTGHGAMDHGTMNHGSPAPAN